MSKRFLTYDESVSVLPDGEYVHTFYSNAFGLVGADWSKQENLEKLDNSDVIELAGEQAR